MIIAVIFLLIYLLISWIISEKPEYVSCGTDCYIVGGDGNRIELFNNPLAHDPSWNELVAFLSIDETDKHDYIHGAFECSDFAEMLHNNAEIFGIRAAYVLADIPGYPGYAGHALNAFNTTDLGLVYIDCTEVSWDYPCPSDRKGNISIGSEYIPVFIFPCAGQPSTCNTMGVVTKVYIQW